VEAILALDGAGQRLMPLAQGLCSSAAARAQLNTSRAAELFPAARAPEAALAGLWLYFSCFDEAHQVSQNLSSVEGSFWHGIVHRQEPDPGNAGYWFRRVGSHPVFPALRDAAAGIVEARGVASFPVAAVWDPFRFIDACEAARGQPGSAAEQAMREIQRTEWQLLFDYCAGGGTR
jgi:hypothetical protein